MKLKILAIVLLGLLLLAIVMISDKSAAFGIGLMGGYAAGITGVVAYYYIRGKKNGNFDDERATYNAYRADSIALRTLLVVLALGMVLSITFDLNAYLSIRVFIYGLFYVGILLKIGLFAYLNRP